VRSAFENHLREIASKVEEQEEDALRRIANVVILGDHRTS
jgi:hypothetical protein